MKSIALLTLTAVLALPLAVAAQIPPPPTPAPDPHLYRDAAMNFMAPPKAKLLGRREVTLDGLGQNLETVAAWVIDPGEENVKLLQIQMEAFSSPPDTWEGQFESQMHNSVDGLLIKNKKAMTLKNGMPATFVELAFGEGFTAKKEYAIVFGDTQRGIVISETAAVGELSEQQARSDMSDATAVQYPMNQP